MYYGFNEILKMIVTCNLSDTNYNWSTMIENGIKLYEGRVNDKKRQRWKIGDYLIMNCFGIVNKELTCQITEIRYYKNFGEAWIDLGDKLAPAKTHEDAMEIYSTYFNKNKINKYGVACFGIKYLSTIVKN